MEQNASTRGRRLSKPEMNSESWPSVRTDSVVAMSRTSKMSAACSTLSDSSEMLGGQSSTLRSYSAASGRSRRSSRWVGFLVASRTRSRFR